MPELGDNPGYRVALHTASGAVLSEMACGEVLDLTWGRELSEVSTATLSGATAEHYDIVAGLVPLAHHLSVWRGDDFVWGGLAGRLATRRERWTLHARDHGTLAQRTRTRVTKRYTDADPAVILAESWDAMTSWHGVSSLTGPAAPVPTGLSYGYEVVADQRMTQQVVDDLVKMGVEWTVYAGRPVVLPALRSPALVLTDVLLRDCDFAEEVEVVLDGTDLFTDVRVQGANWAETVAVTSPTGLRTQDLVSLDSLVGAANVRRAAAQIAARRAVVRRAVVVPSGATLSPLAPVTVARLMPGVVVQVRTDLAGGAADWQRVEAVQVQVRSGSERVAVTLGQSATMTEEGAA